ncbi:MAG: hypothetical protein GC161_18950 [Planctomycetaceae bacterium]|nr:hypothetical protein [Planctomycetaceae bacterium]
MKELRHIPRVGDRQVAFGVRLSLDLRGCTVSVATARIEDAIDAGFRGKTTMGSPTEKQIALAAQFGYDISGLSRREGHAVIDDLMTELNHEAIQDQALAPGVTVTNVHDSLEMPLVISSIKPDGTVYFCGGNGKRAWARSLQRRDGTTPDPVVQRTGSTGR